LRAENARLQEELLAERNSSARIREDNSSLREKVERLEGELEAALKNLQMRLDVEAQTSKRNSTAFRNSLKEKEDAIHALRRNHDEGQSTIQRLRDEIDQLQAVRQERDQFARDLASFKSIADEKDKVVNSLRQSINQQKNEIEMLKENLRQDKEVIDSRVYEERDEARRDLAFLKQALEEKDKEIRSLRDAGKSGIEATRLSNVSATRLSNASLPGFPSTAGAEYPQRTSVGSRTSLNMGTGRIEMLEVDLTSDMSPREGGMEFFDDGLNSRGSLMSHISADLLGDDDDVVITSSSHKPQRPSRLGGAGFR
jgi:ABC-type transporter Mla subunit MlaD